MRRRRTGQPGRAPRPRAARSGARAGPPLPGRRARGGRGASCASWGAAARQEARKEREACWTGACSRQPLAWERAAQLPGEPERPASARPSVRSPARAWAVVPAEKVTRGALGNGRCRSSESGRRGRRRARRAADRPPHRRCYRGLSEAGCSLQASGASAHSRAALAVCESRFRLIPDVALRAVDHFALISLAPVSGQAVQYHQRRARQRPPLPCSRTCRRTPAGAPRARALDPCS